MLRSQLDPQTRQELDEELRSQTTLAFERMVETDRKLSQYNFLVNAGGAAGVLAYLGSDRATSFAIWPLGMFLFGVIASGIELRYLSKFFLALHGASFGQARRTPRCPDTPRLDGKLAVVTGATGGIGLEIARGLARRGAALVLPCRDPAKGERVAVALRADAPRAEIALVAMDLEDLASVRRAAESIARLANGRAVELLVENAGVWPQRYAETREGHEIAFGVNVLAHFALRRALAAAGLLGAARVVVLTGDIYILESACTPDFRWTGRRGGMRAYCRSKLGNLWIGAELARRSPQLEVAVVHPGVVATALGGDAGALGNRVKRLVMIPPELGAQMPLICATQPGLESGCYWHNAHGRMRLSASDPARDAMAAGKLWSTCEALAAA